MAAAASMTPLAQVSDLTPLDAWFVQLVDRALTSPAVTVVAVVAAVGVGAVHALTPGHGKAVAAAYLVGGRGRIRDALLLGGVVAAMHSASVLALALLLHLLVSDADGPLTVQRAQPWFRIVSGALVIAVGIALLALQWRRRATRASHRHGALPPEVSPFSRRGLVLLGISGGLLPSPSAFLVLITTSFTGRTWLGLLLVTAFSVGLAATLTAVGVAAVWGREVVLRRRLSQRFRAVVAVAAAGAILVGGIVLTISGIRALAS